MKKTAIRLFFALSLLLLAGGCGAANGDSVTGKLEPADVRPALRTLPFEFTLKRIHGPKVNLASFQGRAHGPHDTTIEFSIGIGPSPKAIPVQELGIRNVAWEGGSGFVYNDNAWPTEFKTSAQWREAAHMSVGIWESLCKAATGEPCPI